ncbi:MAG: hypothetical protein AB8G99_09690 [Planctomycetaceae bacterium]
MNFKLSLVAAITLISAAGTAAAASPGTIDSGTITGNGSNQVIEVNADGAFDVNQVKVGDTILTEGVDYSVDQNNSSSPTINLVDPPGFGETVTVTGEGANRDPNVELSWGDKADRAEVAAAAALWLLGLLF